MMTNSDQTISTDLYFGAMGTRTVDIEYKIDKHGEAVLIAAWLDIDNRPIDVLDMMPAKVTDKLHDMVEQTIEDWKQASAELNAELERDAILLGERN